MQIFVLVLKIDRHTSTFKLKGKKKELNTYLHKKKRYEHYVRLETYLQGH